MSNFANPVPDYLANKNAHPRDQHITFDEGPHIYYVHGDPSFTSVTTWNHSHFAPFETEKVLDNTMKSRKMNDPTYKYYGMTRDEIKQAWEENRDRAARAGTKMHYDIECHYNGWDVQNDSIEFQYFRKFLEDFPNLKPYRTEWCVYHEELKLSGSIDMVFENENGELVIYDWKRCQEIKHDNGFYTTYATTPCITHLPDTNFWHYALQLNVYKTILEQKYDKKIVDLKLVCIHPNNQYQTYECIQVPFLEKEIEDLFAYRKTQIENS
jgi:ATP-dependent exoDNAse (exonuclease V) beta subunit